MMVPFGLADIKGRMTSQYIQFKYDLPDHSASLELLILGEDDRLLKHLDVPAAFCRPGSYQVDWDGFDDQDCYDTSYLVKGHLRAVLRGDFGSGEEIREIMLKCRYAKVDWLDLLVNPGLHSITATLRVHFKPSKLQVENPPLYNTLHRLALAGIGEYWSRFDDGGGVGHSISLLTDRYNFYLQAVDQPLAAMKTPKILLANTNNPRRSRNWELSRILFYNGPVSPKANSIFKHTAAHEIGHEILLAFGGHVHSKSHKGSSTIFSQRPNGRFKYPATGEIDLMVYYRSDLQHPYPSDFLKRSVASESDVKSVLWLSQLEIKQIF